MKQGHIGTLFGKRIAMKYIQMWALGSSGPGRTQGRQLIVAATRVNSRRSAQAVTG